MKEAENKFSELLKWEYEENEKLKQEDIKRRKATKFDLILELDGTREYRIKKQEVSLEFFKRLEALKVEYADIEHDYKLVMNDVGKKTVKVIAQKR